MTRCSSIRAVEDVDVSTLDRGHVLPNMNPRLARGVWFASSRIEPTSRQNTGMIRLYWHVGRVILARQEREGWGAKVIDRLSYDLRQAFPGMGGLSARNLKYMRAFASAWSDREIVQAPLAQLTWYHHLALLEKLDDKALRLWYAKRTVEHGWSRNILAFQIAGRLHAREGKALNNFKRTLPPADSDFAAQVFKDPYLFDFLGTADPRQEHEVEASLVAQVERFLLELGSGFAFVGRQVPLEVGGDDFKLDLLFYHFKLRRFVVVELNAVKFDAGMVVQQTRACGCSRCMRSAASAPHRQIAARGTAARRARSRG
jgi:predicted nuclease of restriction endonuclease-like (RecB) superfamily